MGEGGRVCVGSTVGDGVRSHCGPLGDPPLNHLNEGVRMLGCLSTSSSSICQWLRAASEGINFQFALFLAHHFPVPRVPRICGKRL